jgi:hypothetical protein
MAGQVIYVGRTSMPKLRQWGHRSSNTKIGEMLKEGIATFNIIDEVFQDEVLQFEKYWINQMQQWGFKLLNTKHIKPKELKFKPLKKNF